MNETPTGPDVIDMLHQAQNPIKDQWNVNTTYVPTQAQLDSYKEQDLAMMDKLLKALDETEDPYKVHGILKGIHILCGEDTTE